MPRTITFTYKKTGKKYDMPWEGEDDPTPTDLANFVDRQENPTLAQRASDAWSWINQPLSDLPSRISKRVSAPLWRYGESEAGTGYLGKAARGGAALTENLGDIGSSLTSIPSLGLAALSGGSSLAARAGLARAPQIAQIARGVQKGASAGFAGHGAYTTGKGLQEGDTAKVLGGLVEGGIGAFGLRGQRPATPSTGLIRRPRYSVEDLGSAPTVTDLGPIESPVPPEPSGLPSLSERGLPSARPTYYGGPVGGPVSTDVSAVPTRSFAGGPGRGMPTRNWSGGLSALRPTTPMRETTPALPNRDILPQTSPYGRIFGSAAQSDLPVVEGEVAPIPPINEPPALIQPPSPVIQPSEPPPLAPVGPIVTTEPPITTSEIGKPGGKPTKKPQTLESVGRPISQLAQDLAAPPSPKDILANLKANRPTGLPTENDKVVRHAFQRGFIQNSGDVEDFMSMGRDQYLDELGIGKGKTTAGRPFAKTDDASLKTFADMGDAAAAQEIKFRETKANRATKVVEEKKIPPSDAFDRGEFETEAYSHDDFVKSLQESLEKAKTKSVAERIKGEKGAVLINKPHPLAKQVTLKWARKMTAADEWGRMAKEDVTANPQAAHQILGDLWTQQRAAGLRPMSIIGTSPDEVAEYVSRAKKAIAQSEFHETLANEGWLNSKGRFDTSIPEGKAISEWAGNYIGRADRPSQLIGGTAGFTKNIYLAGGIPKTPLNIHGYNIGRSDIMARGFAKGTKGFAQGVFNPKADIEFVKANRRIIPEAMEHGFQWHGIENYDPTNPLTSTGLGQTRVGKGIVKGVQKLEDWWEKPLFGRYLPTTKLRFLVEKVPELQASGLNRSEALRQASSMANNFYGGIEKALRSKTSQNYLRGIALAPDWFESRLKLAGNQLKAIAQVKDIAQGKVDPTYLKSLGRTIGMRLVRDAVVVASGKSLYDVYKKSKPSEMTTIPAGTDVKGKRREIPTLGTAGELERLTEEGLARTRANQDPGAIFDIIKNRASQPASSTINVIYNRDEFGNPLRGIGKFGKPIGWGKSAWRTADQLTRPIQPQQIQALTDYLEGNISGEEAVAKGLELPVQYRSQRTFSQVRRRR